MKFLYPEFLWGLLALVVPIIIHLFNFKKFKKEYFSNISFLKEVKLETQNKSKLKHLLILFTRLVALAMLVVAFAQPYIPSKQKKELHKNNVVAVYLDNSLSMDTKTEDGYLFDIAKETAQKLVNTYSSTTDFVFLNNNLEGKHQRLVSKKEIISFIEETELTPFVRTFDELYQRMADLMAVDDASKTAFWFSDFQKNTFDVKQIEVDSTIQVRLLPIASTTKHNLYIDSVWFEKPLRQVNVEDELNVRIINHSDEAYKTKVNLKINEEIKGMLNASISANTTKIVKVNYSLHQKGEQYGEVYLSDYPNPELVFDDRFLFSYTIKNQTNILYLSSSKQVDSITNNIVAVFANDANYKLTAESFSTIDYSSLSNYALLIIDGVQDFSSGLQTEIENYLKKGGSVLCVPNSTVNISSYQSFFTRVLYADFNPLVKEQQKATYLNKEHTIYNNVFERIPKNLDLPFSNGYYPVTFKTKSKTDVLMALQNDVPFITVTNVGKGNFYFIASPLEFTSLVEHALFVPTLLRIAENSKVNFPLFYDMGRDRVVVIPNQKYDAEKLMVKQGEFEFIPELIKEQNQLSIDLHQNIKNIGHYKLMYNNKVILPLSFNYPRVESELENYTKEELESELEQKNIKKWFEVSNVVLNTQDAEQVISTTKDKKLWWYFVVGMLLFLLLEELIIRFFKLKQ